MNKKLFIILLFVLALAVTLGAVYYLNISAINNPPIVNTSVRNESNQDSNLDTNAIEIDPVLKNSNIIVDENTPKNYNNSDLINIEKEINSLDLSSENDLE
jgi:hypothetical protein